MVYTHILYYSLIMSHYSHNFNFVSFVYSIFVRVYIIIVIYKIYSMISNLNK